jgi:peroxiredoxin Q/BCP
MASTDNGTADLEPGRPAPPFALPDQSGAVHRLEDYAGHWLVLYFYPKDHTTLCTREACGFRDGMGALESLGARVLGVSLDSPRRHATFREKHRLPFPLLSDDGGATARRYGSYLQIACLRVARRHTFIIDPRGRLAKIYRRVDTGRHGAEVVNDLGLLQHTFSTKGE